MQSKNLVAEMISSCEKTCRIGFLRNSARVEEQKSQEKNDLELLG